MEFFADALDFVCGQEQKAVAEEELAVLKVSHAKKETGWAVRRRVRATLASVANSGVGASTTAMIDSRRWGNVLSNASCLCLHGSSGDINFQISVLIAKFLSA